VIDGLLAGRVTDDPDQVASALAGSFEKGCRRSRIARAT
jgi:hypothetical protein